MDSFTEMFVGDVTNYILPNLQPGTTYDVKVFAQYDAGMSGPLVGQGTTCMYICVKLTYTINEAIKSTKLQCYYDSVLEYIYIFAPEVVPTIIARWLYSS